jgi:abhydrolase domain-containing protein 13
MASPSGVLFLSISQAKIGKVCVFPPCVIHSVLLQVSLQIRALILENTFMNLPSLIPTALPLLSPFSFLCHQKWESSEKLPLIPATTPILMLSGLKDELVPKEHMKGLWEITKNRRKSPPDVFASLGTADETANKESEGKTEDVAGAIGKSRYVEFENGSHSKFPL